MSSEAQEVQDVSPQDLESMESSSLEPQLMEIPGVGEVVIGGEPLEVAGELDDNQGDNFYQFGSDCGLVSVSNLLTMAGLESTEDEVVGRAIITGKCEYSEYSDPVDCGATNVYQRQELLATYGISSQVFSSTSSMGSLDAIASYVEAGHGVNIGVNAGYAWGDANYIGHGGSNHSIVVTGTVRDPETGDLKGLIVCDSGLTDQESNALYMPVEVLQDAYVEAHGTTVLVTDTPIR